MTLSEIQPVIAARIAAVPALAAFGAILIEDPSEDPKVTTDAISARLRATGVCIEVGVPSILNSVNTGSGGTFSRISAVVYVAEAPMVAHSPAKLPLVDAVVEALRDQRATNRSLELIDYEPVGTEQGYVLHLITVGAGVRHGLPGMG